MPNRVPRATRWAALLAVALCGGCGSSDPSNESEEVVLLRDAWGVPHVYAESDRAALYGLGWAAAQDRLFQMLHARLIARGRVAEFLGPGFVPGEGDVNVARDRAARQWGWARQAVEAAAALDAGTYALLAAYAQGVNAYVSSPGAVLHPLIAQHGVPLEPWQVEDCLLVWMRFADRFGPDGSEEVVTLRTWESLLETLSFDEAYGELVAGVVCNDAAAVVQPEDVPAETQQAMADYAELFGLDAPGHCPPPLEAPKFSQAWAVAGERTFTGRALLVGEARAEVCWPNQYHEWSVEGASFSVRGIGVAGSPILLAGSSAHSAWSPTALGMDQSDLFSLVTDPVDHPGQYLLDGAWRAFEVDEVETVLVKGAASQQVHYRETVFGPVITPLLDEALPGEEFAARRVPFHDAKRDSIRGALAMMRAGDLDELYAAFGEWVFPSMNVVLADDAGRIGFTVAGDAPVRAGGLGLAGLIPQDGSASANDWIGVLPHGLEPHVLDPDDGVIFSANHMPIGSWYPIPMRFGTGGIGHTHRSRRIQERLDELPPQVDLSEVEALRFDTVHTSRRDLVELGLWLRDAQSTFSLASAATQALDVLEPWWQSGATMDGALPGAALAWHLDVDFHVGAIAPGLVDVNGGGENGMTLFLELSLAAIHDGVPLSADAAAFVDFVLAQAWSDASAHGPVDAWPAWYQANVLTFELVNWKTPEALPPPAGNAAPIWIGPTGCTDRGTLWDATEQDYTHVLELGGPLPARSLLPPGASEHAGPHELDQVPGWEANATKPAPRTLAEVQASGPYTQQILRYAPQD